MEKFSRFDLSALVEQHFHYSYLMQFSIVMRGRLLDSIQVEIPADNASLNLQMFDSNPDNQQAYTVLVQ